jgi:inner membrane protein
MTSAAFIGFSLVPAQAGLLDLRQMPGPACQALIQENHFAARGKPYSFGNLLRMRLALFLRFALIAAIALAILFPLSLIRGKVQERSTHARGVEAGFAQETSGPQVLAGPFIALTCEETYVEERIVYQRENKPLTVRETRKRECPTTLFMPSTLAIRGALPVEERYRGIYPIRFYRASLDLSGEFRWPGAPVSTAELKREWKDAYLVLAVRDVRGIKTAGGTQLEFSPGPIHPGLKTGLNAFLGRYVSREAASALPFAFRLELMGTGRLEIAPVGNSNAIRIDSPWPHPSFVGGFPADEREISSAGFSATWRVSHHATGGGAYWREHAQADKLLFNPRLLGVSLIEPVDRYVLAYRATEYGFLFVLFTFAAFGIVEVLWGIRLHAVQYLLVGVALSVFFLLLLALSEHVAFALAYLCAAASCVALLTYYLRTLLGGAARTAAFGALFASLYGSLYVLLRSEDHALLLGSLLVFAALAAVMLLTRRLDWSALSRQLAARAG